MTIRVNGVTIDKWCNLSVTLIYDSVKSVFSFDLYWEPQNADLFWRHLLLPGAYNVCSIVADSGEILITGVIYSPSFKSGSEKYLVNISGCSLTGVLDDVEYSAVVKDTSASNLTLFQVACNCANRLGIYVISKTGEANKIISNTNADVDQKCTEYLAALSKDLNTTLTHDQYGNLVIDVPASDEIIYNFTDGMPGVKMELLFNGEGMHSVLIGKASADIKNNSPQAVTAYNPYVPSIGGANYRNVARNNYTIAKAPLSQGMQIQIGNEYNSANRPGVYIQTDTDPSNLQDFINQKLAEELKTGIVLTIEIEGWTLGDTIPRPPMLITVLSPENYLFQPTKFLIESAEFSGDPKQGTTILRCVVPEVYNNGTPANIFTAQKQNLKITPESSININSGEAFKPGSFNL